MTESSGVMILFCFFCPPVANSVVLDPTSNRSISCIDYILALEIIESSISTNGTTRTEFRVQTLGIIDSLISNRIKGYLFNHTLNFKNFNSPSCACFS